MIRRHPQYVPPATIVHRPVSTLDIAPTIVDYVLGGIGEVTGQSNRNPGKAVDPTTALSKMEGSSLRPLLEALEPGGSDVDGMHIRELGDDSQFKHDGYSVSFWENDPPTKWGYA